MRLLGAQPLRRRGYLAPLEGRRIGLLRLVRVGLFASMVAPLDRARPRWGAGPAALLVASLLRSGLCSVVVACSAPGPAGPPPPPGPPSSALGSVVVCRSSALWASCGGVVGFAPLGACGPSGSSPPSVFCRRRPRRLLNVRHFSGCCGVAGASWHIRAGASRTSERPARRAVLDPPSRLCGGVDKSP